MQKIIHVLTQLFKLSFFPYFPYTRLKDIIPSFQVLIMKMLEHPNIVNLIEVIDDPESDHFYMGNNSLFLPFGFVNK